MKNKKCVLVLGKFEEDFNGMQMAIDAELSQSNCCVHFYHAKDGLEAASKSNNQRFDAVILDPEAPKLFEGEFIKTINGSKGECLTEIFIVSTYSKESLPPISAKSHFIKKPYSTDELVQGLIKVFSKSQSAGDAGKKFAVDVRVINAVIKATMHVCKQFGLEHIQMLKPENKVQQNPVSGDVASSMPIKSLSFNGALVVSFDKQSYLQMLTTMLGEEQTEINADNADAIGEINNIIFGNAKPDFTQYGVELATPVILNVAEPLQIPAGSARMLVPFKLEKGQFYIEVIAYPAK